MTNPTHYLRPTDPTRTHYVVFVTCALTAEDKPEDELWLCSDLGEAEARLRLFSEAFLSDTWGCDNLPRDAELVSALHAAGVHVRLYECQPDGDSGDEVTPFERVPELLS